MSIYESPSSAPTLARYLATYITDDSTIIAHVNHRFGVTYDKTDIAKFRSSLPKRVLQGQGQMGRNDTLGALNQNFKPYQGKRDPLLVALAQYHLKHSRLNDNEREYYRRVAR